MNTCGTCKHYHEIAVKSLIIGTEKQGECREGPPSATSLPVQDQRGNQAVQVLCRYPLLPVTFPACSRYLIRGGTHCPGCDHTRFDHDGGDKIKCKYCHWKGTPQELV